MHADRAPQRRAPFPRQCRDRARIRSAVAQPGACELDAGSSHGELFGFGSQRAVRRSPVASLPSMRRAVSRTWQRADMLRHLPRQAAAKAAAPRLADVAFMRPMRRAADRVTVDPHLLLESLSAGP